MGVGHSRAADSRHSGLFFSSLDYPETNVDARNSAFTIPAQNEWERSVDRRYAMYDFRPEEPLQDVERVARHEFWSERRAVVASALRAAHVPERRIDAFDRCGNRAFVERGVTSGRVRLSCNHCHDRFCEACSRSRAAVVRGNLLELMRGRQCRLVTLTLRHTSDPLNDQISFLLASFRRLRQRAWWKKRVKGGAAIVEVKRSECGNHWHPHLHIICHGSYMDQGELSDQWRGASKGSFIVDVRLVGNTDRAVHYVTKYVQKPIHAGVYRCEDWLVESVRAFAGRRLLVTFGDWRGDRLDEPGAESEDWVVVGRLADIAGRARAGCIGSIALLVNLGNAAALKWAGVDRPPGTGVGRGNLN